MPAHAIAFAAARYAAGTRLGAAVHAAVAGLARTKIITQTDDYLHAECSSAVFGFVDDLELHLRPAQNLIAVRSAARLGHSDFGVNRKRVESLRSLLTAARNGPVKARRHTIARSRMNMDCSPGYDARSV